MEVEMFVDQINYMSGLLSQSAGVRVIVHPPDDHPKVEEMGLNVMPGTETSIAISKVSFTECRIILCCEKYK